MPTIAKDKLKEILTKGDVSEIERRMAELRLNYSEVTTLLNPFVSKISNLNRIYPQVRPTQKTGRYSTTNPPLTNFPKKCINPQCPTERHRKTKDCWSLRDVIMPDEGEFWYDGDADAIEARIYALVLQWEERLDEFANNLDIHTPVTCALFNLPLPYDLKDPHGICDCKSNKGNRQEICCHCQWREQVKWQGKDDKRRTVGKNLIYGGNYFYVEVSKRNIRPPNCSYKDLIYNPEFVLGIPNIHEQGLVKEELISLAHAFFKSNYDAQYRKAVKMEEIRKSKISRNLYGARRVFWQSTRETAKEGFNQSIQSTVADYMNETEIAFDKAWPDSTYVHNAHDGIKWSFLIKDEREVKELLPSLLERELSYENYKVKITFTGKYIYPQG
jgi:DNA polymerase I-like protein with 3'-5' exonuclease and polymerase domains